MHINFTKFHPKIIFNQTYMWINLFMWVIPYFLFLFVQLILHYFIFWQWFHSYFLISSTNLYPFSLLTTYFYTPLIFGLIFQIILFPLNFIYFVLYVKCEKQDIFETHNKSKLKSIAHCCERRFFLETRRIFKLDSSISTN